MGGDSGDQGIPWISVVRVTASQLEPLSPWHLTKSPVIAAQFGNIVASITIMKKGTGTASPSEVLTVSNQLTN